jgi:hypothetical protein
MKKRSGDTLDEKKYAEVFLGIERQLARIKAVRRYKGKKRLG